jgi:hypothetical protein
MSRLAHYLDIDEGAGADMKSTACSDFAVQAFRVMFFASASNCGFGARFTIL